MIQTHCSEIQSIPMFAVPVLPDLGHVLRLDAIPPAPPRKPRAKPVYRPHSKFSPDEDFKLCQLVNEHGPNAWRVVAKFLPGRNSRQCRERWLNYLNPGLNSNPWTAAEDALLERTFTAIGSRWVYMMRFFPNRTDAMIKNRFQVLQRKAQKSSEQEMASSDMLSPPREPLDVNMSGVNPDSGFSCVPDIDNLCPRDQDFVHEFGTDGPATAWEGLFANDFIF
jgi:hypothetical protein